MAYVNNLSLHGKFTLGHHLFCTYERDKAPLKVNFNDLQPQQIMFILKFKHNVLVQIKWPGVGGGLFFTGPDFPNHSHSYYDNICYVIIM